MKVNETKPIPLQYAATTSQAGYRRLEAAMLQMGHLRNALSDTATLPAVPTVEPSRSNCKTPT